MSFYVRRMKDHKVSWTGPIRSPHQAQRECNAWTEAGWYARVLPSCPEVKAEVRAWEKAKKVHA